MKPISRAILVAVALACTAAAAWLHPWSRGSLAAETESPFAPAAVTEGERTIVEPLAEDGPGRVVQPAVLPSPAPPDEAIAKSLSEADTHIRKVRDTRDATDRWRGACEHLEVFHNSPHRVEARDIAAKALGARQAESLRKLDEILAFSPDPASEAADKAVQDTHEFCTYAAQDATLPRTTKACQAFDAWYGRLNERRTYAVQIVKANVRKESSKLVDCNFWCDQPDLFVRIEACGETLATEVIPDSYQPEWNARLDVSWEQSCKDIQVSICDEEPGEPDCVVRMLQGRYPITMIDGTFIFEKGSAQLVIACEECTPKKFMRAAYQDVPLPEDPCAKR